MNETICFFCNKKFQYDGKKYRDVDCPHCKTENSIYNLADYKPYEPSGSEKEEEMPDTSELNPFLTAQDVKDGDIVVFKDAGIIDERDFSEERDGSDVRKVLNITVSLSDGREKTVSPNKTSRTAISEVYGQHTEDWVGKEAVIEIAKQNVRGTLRKVIYLSPKK